MLTQGLPLLYFLVDYTHNLLRDKTDKKAATVDKGMCIEQR